MSLIGLISPNLTEDTLVDVYKMLPANTCIEGRALRVGKFTVAGKQRSASGSQAGSLWQKVPAFPNGALESGK